MHLDSDINYIYNLGWEQRFEKEKVSFRQILVGILPLGSAKMLPIQQIRILSSVITPNNWEYYEYFLCLLGHSVFKLPGLVLTRSCTRSKHNFIREKNWFQSHFFLSVVLIKLSEISNRKYLVNMVHPLLLFLEDNPLKRNGRCNDLQLFCKIIFFFSPTPT